MTQSIAANTMDNHRFKMNVSNLDSEPSPTVSDKRVVKIQFVSSEPQRRPASVKNRNVHYKKVVMADIGSQISDAEVEPLAHSQIKKLERTQPIFIGPPEPRASETEPFIDHNSARP